MDTTDVSNRSGGSTTFDSPSVQSSGKSLGRNTISLVHVFQIVTGCGLFFACMRYSPFAAIVLTIIVTPAIIRTGLIAQRFRESGGMFDLRKRLRTFAGSLAVTLMTLLTCFSVFVLVSLAFGLICVGITIATMSATDLLADIGFIGTLGGTIWGAAAAVLSLTWTERLWRIPS
ncbi:MAG: hypothetical protein AAFN77_21175 [Planctomycetota bacterium]